MKAHRRLVQEKKRNIVLISVFRTLTPNKKSTRFCRIAHVAKALSMSYNKAYYICQKAT